MTDPIQIPYTADETGALSMPPLQFVPAPPVASFDVEMDGLTVKVTDTSTRGGLPIAKVHDEFGYGQPANYAAGGTAQCAYPNESQRKVVHTVTDVAGNKATASRVVYPKAVAPVEVSFTVTTNGLQSSAVDQSKGIPSGMQGVIDWGDGNTKACTAGGTTDWTYAKAGNYTVTETYTIAGKKYTMTTIVGVTATLVPVPPPAPSSEPPTQPSPNPLGLSDAVVTGSLSDGTAVNVTVKPGEHLQLIPGRFDTGGVLYFDDGTIMLHNAWVGEGNPTPADLVGTFHIACGSKSWDVTQTIEYLCAPRPFWVVDPVIDPNFDATKFPKYGPESATASYVTPYANADNSMMGPGLLNTQMGNEGEHDWLGLLNAWDAAYIANPTAGNAAVVRGMSDAGNVFPFHAFDTATGEMLDAYAYPKTSMNGNYLGIDGNPFKPFHTSLPVKRTLDQATGHAPSFHVLAAALYGTKYDKAMLSHWTAYLCCWEANYNYRLPNGPTKLIYEEGARGAGWTTRQLAQAAQWSDKPALFEGWLSQRLTEFATRFAAAGPLPILDQWLVYPTNNSSTGNAFAPWQMDFLGQSLGYCLQLGYTAAQAPFNQIAVMRMDSLDKAQHEFSSIYSMMACENGDRANGRRATSWVECLQFYAAKNARVAAAYACAEGSDDLQSFFAGLPSGQLPPNTVGGDFFGYPTSPTGYGSMEQPLWAYIADQYTDDPARAQACYDKFHAARAGRVTWTNPKYNIIQRTV